MPEFTDTKFMTAKEKNLVLKNWETFLKSGLTHHAFTNRLYQHLINHCSFIAHYDINGFYSTYFEEGEDAIHFLSQFDMATLCQSIEYGETYWIRNGNGASSEMYDINTAMVVVAAQYLQELYKKLSKTQLNDDLQRANAPVAKHGLQMSIAPAEVIIP